MLARLLAILLLALLPSVSRAQSRPPLSVDDYMREMDHWDCLEPEEMSIGADPVDPTLTIRRNATFADIARLDRTFDPVAGGWRSWATAVFRSAEAGDQPMTLVLLRPPNTPRTLEHFGRDAAVLVGCFQLADYYLLHRWP